MRNFAIEAGEWAVLILYVFLFMPATGQAESPIWAPPRLTQLIEEGLSQNNEIKSYDMTPEEYGFERAKVDDIRGGNAKENARIVREILGGETGPKRDMVLLNSASAFLVAGMDNKFNEGIERAKDAIDSGRANKKLDALVAFTQDCRPFVRREL